VTTISFVVPTYNSSRTIAACVQSLKTQSVGDVEVVVVDNHSKDGTADLALQAGADIVMAAGPERCAQRNRGFDASHGDIVVFIDSDMRVTAQVASQIVALFESRPAVSAAVIPENSFGEGFWAQCKVLEKSLYVGDESVEAARAFRRQDFIDIGMWNEELTAAEDWDLDDRIRAHGVEVGRVDALIMHDEGRLRLRGTFGKKRYYGRWLAAYMATRPDGGRRLARTSLFNKPGRLLRDPVHTGGMIVMKSVEAAGMFAGMRDAKKLSSS
jgi:glycosyltransferase involved in cell wall biosynthesis